MLGILLKDYYMYTVDLGIELGLLFDIRTCIRIWQDISVFEYL